MLTKQTKRLDYQVKFISCTFALNIAECYVLKYCIAFEMYWLKHEDSSTIAHRTQVRIQISKIYSRRYFKKRISRSLREFE